MSKLKIAVVGLVDVSWGGAHSAQELALNEFISSVEKNYEIYIYEKGWVDLQKSVETKTVVLRDLDYPDEIIQMTSETLKDLNI